MRESYYNVPDLVLCICLFPHKIGALQGIGSRRSMPVEGLDKHVLREVPFTQLPCSRGNASFYFAGRDAIFRILDPSTISH